MAHLLARLGEAALKPHKLATGVWHKAVLSAKNAARLRKETLLEGSEWPYDEPAKVLKRRKPKGHKHDKLKPARQQAIQEKLETMDEKIAAHRAAVRAVVTNQPLIDRLLSTPKMLRLKARTGA